MPNMTYGIISDIANLPLNALNSVDILKNNSTTDEVQIKHHNKRKATNEDDKNEVDGTPLIKSNQ
ncbi:hypothetical protein I4U23_026869 [Adineta vaga]|nr:hypothetical protein I4U23_026869 [Adineta vaga]